MKILAVETSCDETALSLMEAEGGLTVPKFSVLKSIISSQTNLHAPYGGVVPMLAKREHAKNLPLLYSDLATNNKKLSVDLIAVTVGPGLEPALWEGINFARELSKKLNKPILGVNHLAGHIYSNWILPTADKQTTINNRQITLPAICLIASGGHTVLIHMTSLINWEIIGSTRDDAVGEAFDKVARLINLSYPGGPKIEKLATSGNPLSINLPSPLLNSSDFDFSYSGLKTAVLYYLRDNPSYNPADLAASFQLAAFMPLIKKSLKAAKYFDVTSLLLCGGVASSQALRRLFQKHASAANLNFYAPSPDLNTDNAAMIAAAGYIEHLKIETGAQITPLPLVADGNLTL